MSESVPPPSPEPSPRSRRWRVPYISGKWTVFWMFCCLGLTALLIPALLRLPRWIEFEIVLAVWWMIWTFALSRLLYLGRHISDDFQIREPRNWFGKGSWNDLSGCSGSDSEGCLIVVGLIVALIAVWFLIEVAIPLTFLMLYFVIRGMMARVVNEPVTCKENLGLSLLRGGFWATVYTVPLAGVVWLVHYLATKRA